MKEDWNKGTVSLSNHSVKRCEPSNFGTDAQSKKLYEYWITDQYYFDIFCPDLDKNDFTFYNQEGENLVESMMFEISKCKPQANQPGFCKSDKEIEEYIKDLKV